MKYCTKCGASLEDSAQFCRSCGAPVEPVPTEAASTPSGKSTSSRPRRGIAAQFDTIAAGKKPEASHFTYFYGFFQLLYHKSYHLFCRTYLPCCIALIIDLGLLTYALTAVPTATTLSAFGFVLLLIIMIWFVVVSIWLSRYYPQELYKQVNGDADRIPSNILPPFLGGLALVVLAVAALFVGYLLSPTGAADTANTTADSDSSYTESLPEEDGSLPAAEEPAESPAPTDSTPAPADPEPVEETSCLVPVSEPWKGAWCNPDGSGLFIFDATVYTVDTSQLNDDGSITIFRTDDRDGSLYYTYTLSADETELTQETPDGSIVGTFYRPSYDMAPNPLPDAYWGGYTMVEDNTITDFNPAGDVNELGPTDDFIIDAFRFGSFSYEQLTDLGDGTWSAYFAIPPEGGEYTFGFSEESDGLYMTIYSPIDGSVRYRYLRTSQ